MVNLFVVYHTECLPSVRFLNEVKKLKNYELEVADISVDKIETNISIDVVPTMILNNKQVYKGKEAFDKLIELSSNVNSKKTAYSKEPFIPPPDDGKANPVVL